MGLIRMFLRNDTDGTENGRADENLEVGGRGFGRKMVRMEGEGEKFGARVEKGWKTANGQNSNSKIQKFKLQTGWNLK